MIPCRQRSLQWPAHSYFFFQFISSTLPGGQPAHFHQQAASILEAGGGRDGGELGGVRGRSGLGGGGDSSRLCHHILFSLLWWAAQCRRPQLWAHSIAGTELKRPLGAGTMSLITCRIRHLQFNMQYFFHPNKEIGTVTYFSIFVQWTHTPKECKTILFTLIQNAIANCITKNILTAQ